MLSKKIKLNPKVQEALENNKSIVALESTLISHGLPYPKNFAVAKASSADTVRNAFNFGLSDDILSNENLVKSKGDSSFDLIAFAAVAKVRKLKPDSLIWHLMVNG